LLAVTLSYIPRKDFSFFIDAGALDSRNQERQDIGHR